MGKIFEGDLKTTIHEINTAIAASIYQTGFTGWT